VQQPQRYLVSQGTRKLYPSCGCRHQTSLATDTLLKHTKLPLSTWFFAIHLISQAKTSISALALKHDLGVIYPKAWRLHHKINNAMPKQEVAQSLQGAVQLDDTYLGGDRSGGNVGQGQLDAKDSHEKQWPAVRRCRYRERLNPSTHRVVQSQIAEIAGFKRDNTALTNLKT
jgi:hypothetical protein